MMIDAAAVTHAAGDVTALQRGDVVMVRRSATARHDWAAYWSAIGIAIANGATLKVYD